MSKTYTLKLRGQRQVDSVFKIGMGQNSTEGNHDLEDPNYHLGIARWYEMASDRILVLNDLDIDWAIICLRSLAEAADDEARFDANSEARATARGYLRLMRALIRTKQKGGE